MLQELEIRDFALIHHVRVPFTAGFNILTGETGAGKSIVIDALNAVLGGKVGPSIIRPGAERASAEATFAVSPEIMAWLKQNELFDEDFPGLIVSREISKSGSKARVNGTLVQLSLMQELRQKLITIHAQHEARTLQSPQLQLDMIDALGDDSQKKLLAQVKTFYARRKEILAQINEIDISEEERNRRLDFARFQLAELSEVALEDADEDTRIAGQVRALSNVVELESALTQVQQWLCDGDSEGVPGAIDLVQRAVVELAKAAQFDQSLEATVDALNAGLDCLEQEQRALRKYKDRLDTDPETLVNLESRLAQLATVKRKYGPSLADAIERQQGLEADINKLESAQAESDELRQELAEVEKKLLSTAGQLSKKRSQLAAEIGSKIQKELADLGMPHCKFEIAVQNLDQGECSPTGIDRTEFLIAPNPGQPLAPVAKIASGGELSRVMLAVKSIFAHADCVSTVIFDEIETGLSGKVLQAMRDKLAQLALSHQILCITHQPIIASVADNHVEVEKIQTSETTHVTVATLDREARLKAVANMASGQEDQHEALKFAEALFNDSAKVRANLAALTSA